MLKYFFFLIFIAGQVQSKIIPNGIEVAQGQRPEVKEVKITFKKVTKNSTAPSGTCTASWIGPQVLLTAAHCVVHPMAGISFFPKPSIIDVAQNITSIEVDDKNLSIKNVVISTEYMNAYQPDMMYRTRHDFALIVVSNRAYKWLDLEVGPLREGERVRLYGYGFNSMEDYEIVKRASKDYYKLKRSVESSKTSPYQKFKDKLKMGVAEATKTYFNSTGTLRYGENVIFQHDENAVRVLGLVEDDEKHMTLFGYPLPWKYEEASGERVGVLPGDSGGPMMVKRNGKWKIAGIISNFLIKPFDKYRIDQMAPVDSVQLNIALKLLEGKGYSISY